MKCVHTCAPILPTEERTHTAGTLPHEHSDRRAIAGIAGMERTPLIVGADDVECGRSTSSQHWALVDSLPPLPRPKRVQTGEARVGILCSMVFLAVVLMPLHTCVPGKYPPPMTTSPLWIGILWSEGFVIVICLMGILYIDPCTIKRTPETCLPLPPMIAERLLQGASLDGVANVEEDGRVYCVRCLVWRPPQCAMRTHHCNKCERCVSSFDHHCVFFGRCIAGTGCRSGNLPFFRGLLLMTLLGVVTCAVSPKTSWPPEQVQVYP